LLLVSQTNYLFTTYRQARTKTSHHHAAEIKQRLGMCGNLVDSFPRSSRTLPDQIQFRWCFPAEAWHGRLHAFYAPIQAYQKVDGTCSLGGGSGPLGGLSTTGMEQGVGLGTAYIYYSSWRCSRSRDGNGQELDGWYCTTQGDGWMDGWMDEHCMPWCTAFFGFRQTLRQKGGTESSKSSRHNLSRAFFIVWSEHNNIITIIILYSNSLSLSLSLSCRALLTIFLAYAWFKSLPPDSYVVVQ